MLEKCFQSQIDVYSSNEIYLGFRIIVVENLFSKKLVCAGLIDNCLYYVASI